MDGISVETMQRMEALVRKMASLKIEPALTYDRDQLMHAKVGDYLEAQEIVALLPVPPDPDIAEAREVAASACEAGGANPDYVKYMRDGAYDETEFAVKAALAGIKRGRELAAQS